MDRNQAKEFYPILQAFAEGRVIECRTKPSALSKSWQDMNEWTEMKELEYCKHTEYRIKPEPTYRPFKDAEECWQEMQKHQPVGWVKTKDKETRNVVILDWEDKIKLQQFIEDLEQISETYQSPCKELTGINNTIYYLKTIEEAIN